jgi:hypothetical protein
MLAEHQPTSADDSALHKATDIARADLGDLIAEAFRALRD